MNLHLLVSPDDPDHVEEIKRFLTRLTFEAHEDWHACNREDLIRLGRRVNSSLVDDGAALECGAQQFKVSFDQLREAYRASAWAKENILIAVAGSETDGTSGLRDGADATLRQEVEKFAHIIFASSAAQRDYWLGRHPNTSEEDIRERYGGLKPCMHGSDAHSQGSVGVPDGNRYSWIKGVSAFDTLRQACIDPAGRAFVGEVPPVRATPSQVISTVTINDAPWAETPIVDLNPGLVAIIGARGSGKTALADIIAQGCDATSDLLSPASFLSRAQDLLHGASVTLYWQEGDEIDRTLDGSDDWNAAEFSRARYLSQKFVEELCSSTGMTDDLLQEIERVIFESHPTASRDGSVNFQELRDLRTNRFRDARERDEEALADISDRIGTELEKIQLVVGLNKQIGEKAKLVDNYTKDRSKLVPQGSEVRLLRLNALAAAAELVRGDVRFFTSQEQALLSVQDEVRTMRGHGFPEALRKMAERHRATALESDEWKPFLMDYKGDVDGTLARHLEDARKNAQEWRGQIPSAATDPIVPLIGEDAVLDDQPLALLEAEIARLGKLVTADKETATKFSALSRRIADETTALARLRENLIDCEGARTRAEALVEEREAVYARVFEAIVAEENILADLYSPLMKRLEQAGSTLQKLSFSVTRQADIERWASDGEELLDLRRQGPFKGRGALLQIAEQALKPAWEKGTPSEVSAAMKAFRAEHQAALLEHAPVPKSQQADYRQWSKRFANWLYGTDHIKIQYSVDYDGIDIRKLSPGTRGIVLLLLYLALDDADDRPLIIDQPEENLDPKSIFDDLVPLFLAAKSKRQVIMVTHNANLVVNTDADQIIVARAGPHAPAQLPPISYLSGGLESAEIRRLVCDILEGGERAFQDRARRLRVHLDR